MKPDPVRQCCRSPWAVQQGSVLPHPPPVTTKSSWVQAVASQHKQALLVQVMILETDPVKFSAPLTPASAGDETKGPLPGAASKKLLSHKSKPLGQGR